LFMSWQLVFGRYEGLPLRDDIRTKKIVL